MREQPREFPLRGAIVRGHSDQLAQLVNRLIQPPLIAQSNHDQAAVARLIGIEFEGSLPVLERFFIFAKLQTEFGEVGLDSRVAWVEFHDAIKFVTGLNIIPSGHLYRAQIEVSGCVPVVRSQGGAKMVGRLVKLRLALQYAAKQKLGLAKVGCQFNSLP